MASDIWPIDYRQFRLPWVTFEVIPLLQPFHVGLFVRLCISSLHFNW